MVTPEQLMQIQFLKNCMLRDEQLLEFALSRLDDESYIMYLRFYSHSVWRYSEAVKHLAKMLTDSNK